MTEYRAAFDSIKRLSPAHYRKGQRLSNRQRMKLLMSVLTLWETLLRISMKLVLTAVAFVVAFIAAVT